MKQKIQTLLAEMNAGLIDREHALKAALLTVLAAENLVLIGPPGTAKSMVSRRVAQHIQTTNGSQPADDGTGSYFEYLLTKFSTPEEIFGPLSITELKADRFRRNTAGYLPTAQIAFLDEIFKSSSSILNSLLTILNERIFHNGNQPQHVPLRSLISASNELPTGQEELSALYDRFLMRTFVGPVRDDQLHLLFDAPGAAHQPTLQLSAQDFQAVDAAAQQVRMPPDVGEAIRAIWAAHKEAFKEDRREYLSDRRLVKLVKLLRVSAATNHRTEVDLSDAMLLQHCLWNHPDNMDKVREIVIATLRQCSSMVPVEGATADCAEDVSVLGGGAQPFAPKLGQSHSKPKKIKGFVGSGTAQDPIRIGSADDLINMDDPDIAQVGYHFIQTADIDCSGISHWPSFAFKGHYNGDGKILRLAEAVVQPKVMSSALALTVLRLQQSIRSSVPSVFSDLQASSNITNIRLDACQLACSAEGSRIERCFVTGASLVGTTSGNTQIRGCQVTGGWLVSGQAKDTQISGCQVTDGGGLIGTLAISSEVQDCVVVLNRLISSDASDVPVGGIASELHAAVVARCFVAGKVEGNAKFSGIAYKSQSGSIRQCVIGPLDVMESISGLWSMKSSISSSTSHDRSKRIVRVSRGGKLENNASIDTNPGNDEPNGPDGKTMAAARFNQRFFESSLGWDFGTVWQWDAANNRPALRFGAYAHPPASAVPHAANGTPLQDLLTRQVQANIWL